MQADAIRGVLRKELSSLENELQKALEERRNHNPWALLRNDELRGRSWERQEYPRKRESNDPEAVPSDNEFQKAREERQNKD